MKKRGHEYAQRAVLPFSESVEDKILNREI